MSKVALAVAGLACLVSVAASLAVSQDASEFVEPTAEARTVAVTAQTLGCPELPPPARRTMEVTAVTPAAGRDATGQDVMDIVGVEDEQQRVLASTTDMGVPATARLAGPLPATRVAAQGALAAGAVATAFFEPTGNQGGLEAVRCEIPGDSWWFPGIETAASARSELALVNPTPAVAVVALDFYGPDGRVTAPGAVGIPVGAESSQVIDLAGFAPGLEAATVHVRATRGLVVPAVRVERFTATGTEGSDWVPPAAAPAREVVIDPSAEGRAERLLTITNAGTGEALVQGRVLDQDGGFEPPELKDLRVPPGGTLPVDLSAVVSRSAVSIRLTADVPLVAGTSTQSTGPGPSDTAFATSSSALGGQVAAPVPRGSDLALRAVTLRPGGGRIGVAWHDRDGAELGRETVRLPASTVTTWQPPRRDADQTSYIVVTQQGSASSSVHATVEISSGAGISTIPLRSITGVLTRPAVLPAGP